MEQRDAATGSVGRDAPDWARVEADLNAKGYAVLPGMLTPDECDELIAGYESGDAFRKTIVMARYRFGCGEYKYWDYPLPEPVQRLREELYPRLVPIVNAWFRNLNIAAQLPARLEEMKALCKANGQLRPTPLILRYGEGGFNTLHQDLYGDVYFPLQAVVNLNRPGVDFEGGEFVLTEQVPRAQSKATVLTPQRGEMIVFTTNFRPVKGANGFYRARVKHGISEVRRGRRHAVGIIFHDAQS